MIHNLIIFFSVAFQDAGEYPYHQFKKDLESPAINEAALLRRISYVTDHIKDYSFTYADFCYFLGLRDAGRGPVRDNLNQLLEAMDFEHMTITAFEKTSFFKAHYWKDDPLSFFVIGDGVVFNDDSERHLIVNDLIDFWGKLPISGNPSRATFENSINHYYTDDDLVKKLFFEELIYKYQSPTALAIYYNDMLREDSDFSRFSEFLKTCNDSIVKEIVNSDLWIRDIGVIMAIHKRAYDLDDRNRIAAFKWISSTFGLVPSACDSKTYQDEILSAVLSRKLKPSSILFYILENNIVFNEILDSKKVSNEEKIEVIIGALRFSGADSDFFKKAFNEAKSKYMYTHDIIMKMRDLLDQKLITESEEVLFLQTAIARHFTEEFAKINSIETASDRIYLYKLGVSKKKFLLKLFPFYKQLRPDYLKIDKKKINHEKKMTDREDAIYRRYMSMTFIFCEFDKKGEGDLDEIYKGIMALPEDPVSP